MGTAELGLGPGTAESGEEGIPGRGNECAKACSEQVKLSDKGRTWEEATGVSLEEWLLLGVLRV